MAIKSDRVLQIYDRLVCGEVLNKSQLAKQFCVTERSIQRDIGVLRCFLAELNPVQDIVYEKEFQGYRLKETDSYALTNSEILAVCKILLESRSMRRDEMFPILDKLIARCVPENNKKAIHSLIANEKYHYIAPQHNKRLLDRMWEIGQAVQNHRVMEIQYERLKQPSLVIRRIEPVGIMFSEYYFYLVAFLQGVDKRVAFENADDLFPTIYRIDRIREFCILEEHFRVPYKDRFEEGEFRKRIQFMYGGKLERIRFRYTGLSLEAVLDRLPTAKVVEHIEGGWLVEAEVFGMGADMWLKSQGEYVERVEM